MAGYGQFCPVAKTAEVFAERWTPLILRELCCGPAQFNDLRRRLPLMSKTLLTQRLRDLEHHGVVSITSKPTGPGHIYALTAAGEEFRAVIEALSLWGQRHAQHILTPEDFDPHFLLLSIQGQIPREACPAERFVIRFDFRNIHAARHATRSWWILLMHPHVDVCMKNPGHPVDVVVAADIEAFTRAWMGYIGLADEAARRGIAMEGRPEAAERVRRLLGLFDRPHERRFVFAPRPPPDA